ncbi:hypothetical protein [Methanolobus sp.]|uniref:hypothetical protein n=1 Tax=Methanolobus sp. TaxID=1874737 RepID=UPI0025D0FBA8|nr:hypothetical protein [Methanolobus sp.]
MHKTKIGLIVLALLLAVTPHASALNVKYGSGDSLVQEAATLSQYGIENWTDPASPIYDPAVFKAYGKVPPIRNGTQLNEFANKLRNIRDSSRGEIDLYPHGHVVEYGTTPINAYFYVGLYADGTAYSEKHTKKIYDIVNKHAIENGVEDVPVVFSLTNDTSFLYAGEVYEYAYVLDEESIEENSSLEQNSQNVLASNLQDTNDTNKQTPALGVLSSLLAVFVIGLVCRRRM